MSNTEMFLEINDLRLFWLERLEMAKENDDEETAKWIQDRISECDEKRIRMMRISA